MIHLCCHVPGASENSTLTLKQKFQSSTSTFILGTPVLAEGLKQCQNLNQPKSNKFGVISIAGGLCFFPRFHIPWGRAGILTFQLKLCRMSRSNLHSLLYFQASCITSFSFSSSFSPVWDNKWTREVWPCASLRAQQTGQLLLFTPHKLGNGL